MEFLRKLPVVRTLRERGLLFPALVLIAVAGVLLQGALDREPPPAAQVAEEGPPAPPPPEPQPSFRAGLEKTPLAYESDYWLQLAESASKNVVPIGTVRAPGILIAPGLALTSISAADAVARTERMRQAEAEQLALAAGEEETDTAAPVRTEPDPEDAAPEGAPEDAVPGLPPGPALVAVDVEHQLALFTVPGSVSAFMTAVHALRPGAYIGAVTIARDGSPRITPGHLVSPAVGGRPGEDPFEVSITLPASTSIAALVDLDGNLVGVAVEAPDGVRVLSARTALAVVGRMGAQQICQAIEVTDLDEEVLKLLGLTGGVLVERVRGTAFATTAPIQRGDVLLRWNGHDLTAAEEFATLYAEVEPGATVTFRLLRNQRRIRSQIAMPRADCRPPAEPVVHFAKVGLAVEWTERPDNLDAKGWDVMAVREGSPAAEAGLEAADLLVAVDGQSLARATAREPFSRFERRPLPMVVTVLRNARLTLLVVTPADE